MERTSKVEFDIDEIGTCEGGQSAELTQQWLDESAALERDHPELLKSKSRRDEEIRAELT